MGFWKFLFTVVIVVLALGDLFMMGITTAASPAGGGAVGLIIYAVAALVLIIALWVEAPKTLAVTFILLAFLSYYPALVSELMKGRDFAEALKAVIIVKMIPWWFKLLVAIFPSIAEGSDIAPYLASPAPVTQAVPSGNLDGFWSGLWHGFSSPVTFPGSFIFKDWKVFSAINDGFWYVSGFVLGFLGAIPVIVGAVQGTREEMEK